ncbi:MAG: hypothetical protein AAGG68_20845 [Bacteroidota bacterium]
MRKHIFTLFLLSIFTGITTAQSLTDQLQQLQKEISTVDLGRYQYEQDFVFDKDDLTRVSIKTEKVDTKRDRSESRKVTFNLALLNKNMVRRSTSKSEMKIAIRTSKEIVEVYEEGDWKGYDDEVEILCQDIEAAKSLEKLLKEIIPMANEYWETTNALPEQIEDLLTLLKTETKDVVFGEEELKQALDFDKDYRDIVNLQQTEKEDIDLQFSIGDLQPRSVDYEVKSDQIFVSASTKKDRKFVLLEENGELSYDDEIQIFVPTPDRAAFLVSVLKKAIPLCDSLIELRLPQPADQAAASKMLQSFLVAYSFNEDRYLQEISTDCRAVYKLTEEDEKGTETLRYEFNWGDIDPRSKEISLSKDQIEIELAIKGKKKYIEVQEDGEFKAFDSDLTLAAPTVEAARSIMSVIDMMIEGCPLEYTPKDITWLDKTLEAIQNVEEEFSQNLSAADDNPCKLTLAVADKEDNEQYEFDLSSINPRKIELNIRGTTVELSMETKNDEKSINHYDEKGELSYEDEIEFLLPNVENGRTALVTFKALVEGCKAE